MHQVHWYFTGLSENPNEFQHDFWPDNVYRREEPLEIPIGNHILKARTLGGVAYHSPWIFLIYNHLRSIFDKGMTYTKKVTVVLLVPMLYVLYLRNRSKAWYFMAIMVAVHVFTVAALGILAGYAHRYNTPFDLFTITYAFWWLDWALSRYSERTN